jgi:hypothetical protein
MKEKSYSKCLCKIRFTARSYCTVHTLRNAEMANFHLFAANGNGKRKFVYLDRLTIMVKDDCCSANLSIYVLHYLALSTKLCIILLFR